MRQIFAAVFVMIVIISFIVVAFTLTQVQEEDQRLKANFEQRSRLLADSLKETVQPNFISKSDEQLQRLVDKFESLERLAGMAIYDNKGNTVATSSSLIAQVLKTQKIAEDAMDADKATGDFVELNNEKMYFLATPLRDEESVVGALLIAQNAGFIDTRLNEIWRTNLLRLFIQASLIFVAILLIIRWFIYEPTRSLVKFLQSARTGDLEQNSPSLPASLFFRPLIKEISSIRGSLIEARITANEEAKLGLQKFDSPWTEQRLKVFIKDVLKGRTIFMVSNREPYIHTKNGRDINYYVPASGMVTAIEPIMQACGGMWIAQGSGNADRLTVDKDDKLKVPPDEPKYTLKRVWLTEKEEAGYYYGFSNEGLWPLCHIAYTRPTFKKEDWEEYKKVNGKFAQNILSEIKNIERPIVLIQDFQLALVPRMIKNSRPDASVGIFWHIPWPNSESFSVCPWKKEIIDGILGADLIGFQTQLHCNNFIETVSREIESLLDFEQLTITRQSHTSYIKAFPFSIAFPNPSKNKNTNFDSKELLKSLNVKTKYIGVGVDRLDYTKGILERLKAIEIFLKKNPTYISNFTFLQIAAPSRSKIKQYQKFSEDVDKEVERINNLFRKNGWKPILLFKRHHSREEIDQFYKVANICLVTSLHDGMNLVAKEFVAARSDNKGVLILSQFTGASRELKDALIVNPYNGEQTAEAIKLALELSPSEQTKKMKRMREVVKNYNIYRWSAELLKTIINI
ncbi:MAG: Alpha,alpha-trehalose-phosphate synthase (UDP-forming) [Candidatus Levybacteria bacterium GW2011_GWB1_35_5]|nr:MAG: Alpha,alpha-trehalose-phosphate synthase (UDP-forming) [Candidatus Levybacteria bacterium GW2011_GWB1_35_5]